MSNNATRIIIYGIVASSISIFASLIVLITFAFVPPIHKNVNLRYIAYMIISSLIYNISSVFQSVILLNDSDNQIPLYLTYFIWYGLYSSILWGIIFAINLKNIIQNKPLDMRRSEFYNLMVGYGSPLTITIICSLYNDQQPNTILSLLIFHYVPEILAILAIIGVYIKIFIGSKLLFGDNNEYNKVLIREISLYPIVLVITILLIIITQSISIYDNNYQIQRLSTGIIGCTTQLQGLINSVIYGFNISVREEIKNYRNSKKISSMKIINEGNESFL